MSKYSHHMSNYPCSFAYINFESNKLFDDAS